MTTPAFAERFNLYTAIHKALRSHFCDTLVRLGRLDVDDADELATLLRQFDALMETCASHVAHEDEFLHTAMQARDPGAATTTAADHLEHVACIARLRAQGRALGLAAPQERPALALRLYRDYALFVADNLQHMHIEETVNAASLWAKYSDAELFELHGRLVASLTPEENLATARWMVPAVTPFERTLMFKDMKETMPPEALLGVLSHVQPYLDLPGWTKLTRSIRVPQVPGLVEMA